MPCPVEVTRVTVGLEGKKMLAPGAFGDDSAHRIHYFEAIDFQDSRPKECSNKARSIRLYSIATVRTPTLVFSLSLVIILLYPYPLMPHAIGMLLNLQAAQKLVAQVKSVDGMRDNLLLRQHSTSLQLLEIPRLCSYFCRTAHMSIVRAITIKNSNTGKQSTVRILCFTARCYLIIQ